MLNCEFECKKSMGMNPPTPSFLFILGEFLRNVSLLTTPFNK